MSRGGFCFAAAVHLQEQDDTGDTVVLNVISDAYLDVDGI
jgi:hypothetical protein